MRHDLQRYLVEVASRLERFPAGVRICWVEPAQLAAQIPGVAFYFWAMCVRPKPLSPFYVLGISTELLRAPAYVLRWLILHECLHVVIKPYVGRWHPYHFRQAERSHPDYERANLWLDAHVNTVTKTGRASRRARTSGSAAR